MKLCKYLSLWPYTTNRLCQAARDRIMADNGLTGDDLFPDAKKMVDEPADAPLFAGKENA